MLFSFTVPVAAASLGAPSNGLAPCKVDPILMAAAQMQADYLALIAQKVGNGHVGPGGADADDRALLPGYPAVPGLDINENFGAVTESQTIESLLGIGIILVALSISNRVK